MIVRWRLFLTLLLFAALGVARGQTPEPTFRGRTAAEWARTLEKGDAAARTEAVSALAGLGPRAGPAVVPALVKALEDEQAAVRTGALKALGKLGPAAKAAVPVLIQSLDDRDPAFQQETLRSLAGIGPDARAALPALRKLIDAKDPKLQTAVVHALAVVGPAEEVVPVLIKLGGPDTPVPVRVEVLQELGRLKSAKALPVLAAALRDRNDHVRRAANRALLQHGAEAVPALVPLLGDADAATRREAAALLKAAGPGAKQAAADLGRMMKENPAARNEAASVLAAIGADAVPTLIEVLKGKDVDASAAAAYALGRIGPPAKAAAPALAEALRSDNRNLAANASGALSHLGAEVAVPLLAEMLKDGDEQVYYRLRQFGPKAKAAVPALIAVAQKNDDPKRRARAVQTLAELGPAAKEAIPALVDLLGDKDFTVRTTAMHAVQRLQREK